jgi:hypothetical protein
VPACHWSRVAHTEILSFASEAREAHGRNSLLPAYDQFGQERVALKTTVLSQRAGKIDCTVTVKRIRFHKPRSLSIEKKLDLPHTVETVTEELKYTSDCHRKTQSQCM